MNTHLPSPTPILQGKGSMKDNDNSSTVAGTVVGVLVFLLIITVVLTIVVLVYLKRRKKSNSLNCTHWYVKTSPGVHQPKVPSYLNETTQSNELPPIEESSKSMTPDFLVVRHKNGKSTVPNASLFYYSGDTSVQPNSTQRWSERSSACLGPNSTQRWSERSSACLGPNSTQRWSERSSTCLGPNSTQHWSERSSTCLGPNSTQHWSERSSTCLGSTTHGDTTPTLSTGDVTLPRHCRSSSVETNSTHHYEGYSTAISSLSRPEKSLKVYQMPSFEDDNIILTNDGEEKKKSKESELFRNTL